MIKNNLKGLLVASVVIVSTVGLAACGPKPDNTVASTTAEETSTELRISIGNDNEQASKSDDGTDEQESDDSIHENDGITPEVRADNEVQGVYSQDGSDSVSGETNVAETSADYSFMDDLTSSFGKPADKSVLEKALGIKSSDYVHLAYCTGDDGLEVGIFKVTEAQKDKVQNSLSAYVSGKTTGKVDSVADYVYFYTSSSTDADFSYLDESIQNGLSS